MTRKSISFLPCQEIEEEKNSNMKNIQKEKHEKVKHIKAIKFPLKFNFLRPVSNFKNIFKI